MSTLVLALFLIAHTSAPTPAAQGNPQKIKLTVSADCVDPVGELFVYHLREEIRNSAGYSLDSDAVYTLSLVCMDNTIGSEKGLATAVSLVVTGKFDNKECNWLWILQQQVLTIGRTKRV